MASRKVVEAIAKAIHERECESSVPWEGISGTHSETHEMQALAAIARVTTSRTRVTETKRPGAKRKAKK